MNVMNKGSYNNYAKCIFLVYKKFFDDPCMESPDPGRF